MHEGRDEQAELNRLRQKIAGLSPQQRALLQQRLTSVAGSATKQGAIPRRERNDPCPLSFAQQRLWFLDQIEPQSCLYNIPFAVRLRGPLQIDAMRDALNALVARHEVLRTTFAAHGGEPVQVVMDPGVVDLPVLDLRGIPEARREGELERALAAEARRPFNLAADLMLRALLVRVDDSEHAFLITLHHIAADGWSMGILARELTELYAASTKGRSPRLMPLPIQYGDYAMWQRVWLQGEPLAAQLAYWRHRLNGMPPALELPTDRARPTVPNHRGAWESAVLPLELTAALQGLNRQAGATLFMTLLGAFATLLHRYTSADDLVVGTPVAGRRWKETEPLIGFFVNTLVLRADVSGDPTFRDFLARTRDIALEAYDHQDLPFEKLVEVLRPERSPSRMPLVQVMFTLEQSDEPPLALPGLAAEPLRVDTGTAKFDLTVVARHTADGLRIAVGYNSDLYEPATIRRMLGHYQTLLGAIAAHPDRRVSQLPLLTDQERAQLLLQWNAPQEPCARTPGIPELFEAQVARTPDAVAVICEDESLTYGQLNRRANQLAHLLRAHGVGPDAAVGVCLHPSLDLIVALLGVLKAGGAYLPLDPSYPQERLAFMLHDAQAAALVTQRTLVPSLPPTTAPIVTLERAALPAGGNSDNPPHQATGEHLAYLMYTSGSTGRPKAVAVPHRAVLRLVRDTDYVTITPADVMAQASTASFDAATFEVWGALLNGARLLMLRRDVVLTSRELAAALARHGVTLLFLTTALFNQLAREIPAAFRSLRTLLVGGEVAEPRSFAAVLHAGPPQRLVNVYGPTETTTFASWYLVERVPDGTTSLPIGRPITQTQLYVLDRRGSPVPIGVPGELFIGGPGVARNYHGRPGLTAERFLPDPFSAGPGARLYRTGDLARYLPDGAVEFLGRRDHQVKIRGHRIEPGEVEAALRQHPALREALVLAREDGRGERRLVAYVSPAAPGVTPGGLRAFLRERLPAYMVPAAFVLLERLPLSTNGKVDRGALPEPDAAHAEDRADFARPRDPLEELLAEIWEATLDVRPIGVYDEFFEVGGHSLLAVRLIDAIERAVGHRVPLTTLFEHRTIRQLAQALVRQRGVRPASRVTAIHPNGSRARFFFLHGDFTGGGFYCRRLAQALGPEQPFFALHPHGLDGEPVPPSIETMAADQIATVRSLQPRGPYLLGGHCNGSLVAFEMARRLRAQGERVDLLFLVDLPAARMGARARLAAALKQKARRIRTVLRRTLSAEDATRRRHDLPSSPESLYQDYLRAIGSYIPRRYSGTVTLVVAKDAGDDAAAPRRSELVWRSVARDLRVHMTPGDHLTCITRYAAALGEFLAACLADVQPDVSHYEAAK